MTRTQIVMQFVCVRLVYLHVCAYIHACMCVCMCACVCVCMCVCVCACVHVYVYVYTCVCVVYACVYVYVCMRVCVHVCVRVLCMLCLPIKDDLWVCLEESNPGKQIAMVMSTWTQQMGYPVVSVERKQVCHSYQYRAQYPVLHVM